MSLCLEIMGVIVPHCNEKNAYDVKAFEEVLFLNNYSGKSAENEMPLLCFSCQLIWAFLWESNQLSIQKVSLSHNLIKGHFICRGLGMIYIALASDN